MKKFSVVLTVILTVTLLAACVPTERTDINIDPVFEDNNEGPTELDFNQLHNDSVSAFMSENPYSYITEIDISGDNAAKVITVKASCLDGVSTEEADRFLAACMRHISEAAAAQYSRFEGADETSFGPLWDMYAFEAEVASDAEGTEPVEKITVPAGKEIPFSPDIESYEEEWEKAVEIYLRNIG